jgi:predicted  nucleic acid-binding Zn-ribbon protein
MAEERDNSWTEWSKHVLKELERLNANYESIKAELADMREEIAEIKATTTIIGELKQWKKDIDDVASPSQLRDMKIEIERLKTFKTISTTAWLIVQIAFGAVIAILNYLK